MTDTNPARAEAQGRVERDRARALLTIRGQIVERVISEITATLSDYETEVPSRSAEVALGAYAVLRQVGEGEPDTWLDYVADLLTASQAYRTGRAVAADIGDDEEAGAGGGSTTTSCRGDADARRKIQRSAVAERLWRARSRASLSQTEVGRRLGFHRPVISQIELGKRAVKVEELVSLAELYGVDVGWLACGTGLRERGALESALRAAATSLRTLSYAGGRDSTLSDLVDVRGYAANRASVALDALSEGDR
ncbi:MAG: helix-turn-helix transcriptional regulator [Myxococcales bacterium]|nr:helix-turn-helix transcriptional regulator [Myxococcales bacterium]